MDKEACIQCDYCMESGCPALIMEDGYPIEFNLNLEGQLANVLRSGLASYQIPDRIRERMQGFAR